MIKYLILATCLLLLPHAAYSANSEGMFTVLAHGGYSCGKFIAAVNEGNNNQNWIKWNNYQIYASGYFTGVNAYRSDTKNIKGSTDMEGIMAFMEKYCRENPLENYFNAIIAVETELYPQRNR